MEDDYIEKLKEIYGQNWETVTIETTTRKFLKLIFSYEIYKKKILN